jgi:hypothetical protein
MSLSKLELAKAFAPLLVALIFGAITAYIAWRQYKVASTKLNLELFDRRYMVFNRLWIICADAVGKQGILLNDKYLGTRSPFEYFWPKARFLFGEEIDEFIQQVITNWLTLCSFEHQIKNDVQVLESDERRRLYHWFQDYAPSRMQVIFRRYLDLSAIK